jgi:hypothetical protein
MRRANGRRRAARVVLVLAIMAVAFGGIALGIAHSYALQDFTWSLAPRQ